MESGIRLQPLEKSQKINKRRAMFIPDLEVHLFPSLRVFWFLKKTALHKTYLSGTVIKIQLTRNSPTNIYSSDDTSSIALLYGHVGGKRKEGGKLDIFSSIRCKFLNARFESNDIEIFMYNHYPCVQNAKTFDTRSNTCNCQYFNPNLFDESTVVDQEHCLSLQHYP